MKKVLIVILLFISCASITSAQKLTWLSWNEGYEKSKKENKPILVFVYSPGCHINAVMNEDTFNNDEISELITKTYIPVRINVDRKEELYLYEDKQISGDMLVAKISKNKFEHIPTTIFLKISRNKSYTKPGYKKPEEMKPLLQKYANL